MEVFMVLLWNISWRVFLLPDVLRVGEQVLWKDRPLQEHGPLASKNEHRVFDGVQPNAPKTGFLAGSLDSGLMYRTQSA